MKVWVYIGFMEGKYIGKSDHAFLNEADCDAAIADLPDTLFGKPIEYVKLGFEVKSE